MRDGSTRRRSTSPQETTWTPERVQVDDWRRHDRLDDLRALAEGARGLALSRGLLHALLEELHVSDDFDVLVGRVSRLPASQYPRLLAIALLLRHSWCPQDLARTATRLGLSRQADSHSESRTTRSRLRPPPSRSGAYAAPRATYRAERRSHVERIVLAISIHTRSPRAGTRLRLPSAARQRRTRRRRARPWC